MTPPIGRRALLRLGVAAAAAALTPARAVAAPTAPLDARETRLGNLRRLTAGGQNAEAYWDATGTRLIFQSTRPPHGCDQMFTMRADGSEQKLLSSGAGRTTCGFFFPDGGRVIYASTHLAGRPARHRPTAATATCGPSTRAGTSSRPTPTAGTSSG